MFLFIVPNVINPLMAPVIAPPAFGRAPPSPTSVRPLPVVLNESPAAFVRASDTTALIRAAANVGASASAAVRTAAPRC